MGKPDVASGKSGEELASLPEPVTTESVHNAKKKMIKLIKHIRLLPKRVDAVLIRKATDERHQKSNIQVMS